MSLHTEVKGQFGLGTGRAMGKALKKDPPVTMFIGRAYRRQKRKVPLSEVHYTETKRPRMSQWIPPTQNVQAREEDWFRGIYCSHRAFCGCNDPVSHLASLAAAFGFQPAPSRRQDPSPTSTPPLVRNLRALPAAPTTPRPPPCGGTGGRGAGGDRADDGGPAEGEEFQSEDVGELLDILDDAE